MAREAASARVSSASKNLPHASQDEFAGHVVLFDELVAPGCQDKFRVEPPARP